MKKMVLAFLMLCFSGNQISAFSTPTILPQSAPPERTERFHIGAIGADLLNNGDGISQFLSTATKFQIPEVDVISIGSRDANQQINDIIRYLAQYKKDEVVLIVDGLRSLFLDDAPSILKTFEHLDTKFIIAATRCHPNIGEIHNFPDDARTLNFPDSSSFMGEVGRMKEIMKRLLQLSNEYPSYNLTQLFNIDLIKHEDYALDYHALLFLDLCGISPENGDIVIRNIPPYVRTHLEEAHNRPKVVNSDGDQGGGDSVRDAIFNALFPELFGSFEQLNNINSNLQTELNPTTVPQQEVQSTESEKELAKNKIKERLARFKKIKQVLNERRKMALKNKSNQAVKGRSCPCSSEK